MSRSIAPQPADFAAFWAGTLEALAAFPPAPEQTPMARHSADNFTLYGLRLTSLDGYRIFAYYSVPHGDGPFPVFYRTPNYGSVVHVPPFEERQQYISVALCHRGQRLADQPFAAAYPGLLTTGIEDPARYIYRGIVADCCRVVDFLLTRNEVDAKRIAVMGGDLALMTAALREQVSTLYYTPGFFYGAQTEAATSDAYPIEELNEYINTYPDRAAQLWRTLSYFEAGHFASQVQADTLVVTDENPETDAQLLAQFTQPVETYVSAHSSYQDGVHAAQWIGQRCNIHSPLVPEHWG